MRWYNSLMRDRKEIENSFKGLVVPSGSDHIKLQLELLLDIRDLLIEAREARVAKEVAEARAMAEEERVRRLRQKVRVTWQKEE